MRHGMRNPRDSKNRRYAACLIGLNKYLVFFPGATLAEKIGVTGLDEILLNSMPNNWSKQVYVQGFYCSVKMFKHMDIDESID